MENITTSVSEPTAENRYYYYEFLHFIPVELKNKYWAAQCLLYNKYNSQTLIEAKKVKKYRDADQLKINVQEYKNIIDPPQKDGSGGKADFFASSWKPNPINIHLKNILQARLDRLPLSLTVKAADEYFKTNLQAENDKIIGRRKFLLLINEMNKSMGLPLLRPDEDPYTYVKRMMSGINNGTVKTPDATRKPKSTKDIPTTLLDNIKSLIDDNEGLALYNSYVHKDGVEIACELAIEYYNTINKFTTINDRLKADIRNFNTGAMRFYTSKTTGLPVLEYVDASMLLVSGFKKPDASDCTAFIQEYDISFGEFVRQVGAGLSKEQLRQIFDMNRTNRGGYGAGHNLNWEKCTRVQRENAMIRVGYMEWQTQDMEVYGSGNVRGNVRFQKKDSYWEPSTHSYLKRENRYYNCWYKCYYIPAFGAVADPAGLPTSDFEKQAALIFDFGKLQDQYREGEDNRYARSSFVLWHNVWPSWTDIEDSFMPKINLLFMQYENDLSNAVPHGLFFSEEAFTELLETVDEAQRSGKDNNLEAIRRLRQSGWGVGKLFDEQGKRIPPFVEVKTSHLVSAKEKLIQIMDLYAMMMQSLSMNEIAEGAAPKPRTSLGGLQLAMDASNNATYFIEKGYTDIYNELGYRYLGYIKDIVIGGGDRFQEFCDIVAEANGWALEGIKDIPYRKLGITVDVLNTTEHNNLINQLALEMSTAANPMITPPEALELTFIQNVKYKFAILRLKMKRREKEMMERQAAAEQFQRENLQLTLQIEQAKIQARYEGEAYVMNLMKKWDERLLQMDAQLKFMTQTQIKNQIKDNRIEQDAAAMQLEQNKEAQASLV